MRAPILYLAITAMALVLPGCGGGGGGDGGGGGSDTDDTGDRAEDGLTLTRIDTAGIGESAERSAPNGPAIVSVDANTAGDVLLTWASSPSSSTLTPGPDDDAIVWFNVKHGAEPWTAARRWTTRQSGSASIYSALDNRGEAAVVTLERGIEVFGRGLVGDTPVRRIELGATPAQLSPPSPGLADGGATALVAWRFGLIDPGLRAAAFTAGAGWRTTVIPSLTTQEQADEPDLDLPAAQVEVVELGGGTRLAVWVPARPVFLGDIRYNVKPQGGEWSDARILVERSDETGARAVTGFAASEAGNAVLTYAEINTEAGTNALRAIVFDGATPSPPQTIVEPAAGGQVVMDAAGNAIVNLGTRTIRYDDGQFGSPQTVTAPGPDVQILVDVNGAGDAVAVWRDEPEREVIYARRATRAEPSWSQRVLVVDEDDGDLIAFPGLGGFDVAVDAGGTMQLAWTQGARSGSGPDGLLWVTSAPLATLPDIERRSP